MPQNGLLGVMMVERGGMRGESAGKVSPMRGEGVEGGKRREPQ